jgi:hypothetical protein
MPVHTIAISFEIETDSLEQAHQYAHQWVDRINSSEPFDPLPNDTIGVFLDSDEGTEHESSEGEWDDDNYNRFAKQLESAGYEVVKYEGRGYYRGPAGRCDSERTMGQVLAITTVPCRWDNLGKGAIVYPR